jgi:hypothetical protein
MEANMKIDAENGIINMQDTDNFVRMNTRIIDNNLEIRYIDNSNISMVKSGKIENQVGWYIKQHDGVPDSKVHIDARIFENIKDLFLFLGKE